MSPVTFHTTKLGRRRKPSKGNGERAMNEMGRKQRKWGILEDRWRKCSRKRAEGSTVSNAAARSDKDWPLDSEKKVRLIYCYFGDIDFTSDLTFFKRLSSMSYLKIATTSYKTL